ncbi:MCE family protein [Rhodococcus sp. KBS0724]|jgi:phospholipid/cholesterol/gamma-HCH transport system substrate-binding protein|uniref:MCE family protein n=1 Tax=Rhodococcus sp. KBS0724 TaxID=1179674 RepID=UPI00110D6F69|nr:MlaD family protein [Rhodococcus sp. KBS0724]TSD49165.1 MCE family protein [Rhodococcus sp. KBS0724]
MSYRKPLIGIAVFLLISCGLTWTVFVTLQRGVAGDTTSFSAVFTDASGLRAGDDVRMAGVRVGRVDSVSLDGTLARVAFRIESDQALYGNTKAAITYQNIIGQRYLGLSLGEQGEPRVLTGGDEIPVENTEPSFDISVLLNGFEPLFSVLDPQQIDNVTTAIITALQGDSGSITTLVSETSTLAESFAGPDKILGDIIVNLDGIVRSLAMQSTNVDTMITQAQSIFEQLAARRGEMVDSLDSIALVADQVATLSSDVAPDLSEFLTREPGFAQHFLDNKDTFGYFGFNLPPMLKGLARASQDGSYINTYLCNLNLTLVPAISTVIPALVAQSTPGGQITQSKICR